MKILVFGNEFYSEDSLAKELLAGVDDAVMCDSPEDILKYSESGEDFVIVDVVKGLDKVRPVTVDELKSPSSSSVHDFDLSFYLQLLQKTGKLTNVKIIGIPPSGDRSKIKKDLFDALKVSI
ncbi:hypothetical protein ACFLQI_01770 [Candidatus Undinarchaeota archaeon]